MWIATGINIPAPDGERDLKNNPKLKNYCACFGEKLAAWANGVNGKVISMEESTNKELAMRNSCRQKYDLPQVKIKP